MRRFAETCESVANTTKRNEKIRLVAEYLRSLAADDAARAAVFFTGRPFPRLEERVLGVGGSLILDAVSRLIASQPGSASASFDVMYRKHGDLGAMTEELFASHGRDVAGPAAGLSLSDLEAAFQELGARRGAAQKLLVLERLFQRADPLECKYIVKIITGDLRIGLKESLVEEAIARGFNRPVEQVQRANMLVGDIGATLRLAARDQLSEASLRLFNPIGCMLATPVETPDEVLEYLPHGAILEDKYDGIRAQAHKRGNQVKLFSRTLDEITEYPELSSALRSVPGEFVLDGEVLAWRNGRALPFTELQQRLGRKQHQPGLWSEESVPVAYMAFDLIYENGRLLLDVALHDRRQALLALLRDGASGDCRVLVSPAATAYDAGQFQHAFESALARGNEGLMAKEPQSLYTPGRRGRSWLKLKRPMSTLDVVVTAVEYGHGRRHGVLSDYTFSVRTASPEGGSKLLSIGKAYSGLTDSEILELTEYFKQHTIRDEGFRRTVEPTVVIEVAFNNIQVSDRHESGYALRFPRIVRLRPDKLVSEIDTLDRVQELYSRQSQ